MLHPHSSWPGRQPITLIIFLILAANAAAQNPRPSATPKTWDEKQTGIHFIEVKPGTFLMGEGKDAQKKEVKTGFYLASTVVTQKQWKSVMKTEPWKGKVMIKEGDDYPATWVSWEDANAFCKKLSESAGRTFRLPTETEWEYACRAGTKTRYFFGDQANKLGDYAWFYDNATHIKESWPHQVSRKKPNPWGFYDMHGNTWQWCYDEFQSKQVMNFRVIRGGAFFGNADSLRVAYRTFHDPKSSVFHLSFRLLMELPNYPPKHSRGPTRPRRFSGITFDKTSSSSRDHDLATVRPPRVVSGRSLSQRCKRPSKHYPRQVPVECPWVTGNLCSAE